MGPWSCATLGTLTEQIESLSSGGADAGTAFATATQATAGSTGALTVTFGGTRPSAGFLISVKAPSGDATVNAKVVAAVATAPSATVTRGASSAPAVVAALTTTPSATVQTAAN